MRNSAWKRTRSVMIRLTLEKSYQMCKDINILRQGLQQLKATFHWRKEKNRNYFTPVKCWRFSFLPFFSRFLDRFAGQTEAEENIRPGNNSATTENCITLFDCYVLLALVCFFADDIWCSSSSSCCCWAGCWNSTGIHSIDSFHLRNPKHVDPECRRLCYKNYYLFSQC